MTKSITERIKELATKANADGREAASEQYLFCDDLLAAADIAPTAARVEFLDSLLDEMLEVASND